MLKEGSEYDQFWKLLGIKSEYPSQKITKDQESDAHLFCCTYSKGKKRSLTSICSRTPHHSVCALLICVMLLYQYSLWHNIGGNEGVLKVSTNSKVYMYYDCSKII